MHKRLTATHTCYIWRRHRTHTRTRRPEVAVNSTSAFNPSRIVPPPGSSRSSGQLLSARGPSEPSVSVRDGQECVLFACFFLLGFLVEETPCEHGENMQTPHRKAREIAHLSTEGLGRTCPPEPTAPHAGIEPMTFLLSRRQCKHLSHHAMCVCLRYTLGYCSGDIKKERRGDENSVLKGSLK